MDTTTENLNIKVTTNAGDAGAKLKSLASALRSVKEAAKGQFNSAGMKKLADDIRDLTSAAIGAGNTANVLSSIASSLTALSNVGKISISSTIAKGISDITAAASQAGPDSISNLSQISSALGSLSDVGDVRISTNVASVIEKLSEKSASFTNEAYSNLQMFESAMRGLSGLENVTVSADLGKQISDIANAAAKIKPESIANLENLSDAIAKIGGVSGSVNLGQVNDLLSQMSQLGRASLTIKDGVAQATSAVNGTSGGFLGLLKSLGKTSAGFLGLGDAAKSVTGRLGGMLSALKRIAFYRIIRSIIKEIGQAMKEGLEAAYNFSSTLTGEGNRFAAAMDRMSAATNQMKGQMGSAFAGLLTAIAPVLEQIISYVTSAFNAISQVLAAFTGGTYLKAIRAQSSLGSAAESAASGTKNAAAAQAELNRQLMGFDEIEKLNEDRGGGGGGSSGGGGGGSNGAGDAIQFVESQIESQFSTLADMIREAWANADFTEIGGIIGAKLRDALDSIDWGAIRQKTEQVAKSFATLFNGFLETEGLSSSIGKTIAEAINTAFNAENTFYETFHFDSLGRFITSGLQTAFQELDFSQITRLLSNKLKAALNFATGLIEGIDWSQVPQDVVDAIKEAISGFDFKGVFSASGKLIGTALTAAIDLVSGIAELFGGFFTSVWNYFTDHISEAESAGGCFADGIWNGIKDAFAAVDTWVYENIVQPFADGFGQAFDISGAIETAKATILGFVDYVKDIKFDFTNFNPFDGNFGITLPEEPLSVYIEGRMEKIDTSYIPANQKLVDGMVANLTGKKKGSGFSSLLDLTANLTKKQKQKGFDSYLDLFANLTRKRKQKGFDSYLDLVANLTNRTIGWSKNSSYWTISGFTAQVDVVTGLKTAVQNAAKKIGFSITGKASGGAYYNGSWHALAGGGIIDNGLFQSIPKYAGGTSNAHGSLFLAGEAGPEIVGHVGGRTEVLNRSQLAATMYASVVAGMATVSAAMLPSIHNSINYGALAYNTAQTASVMDDSRWIDRLASRVAETTRNTSGAQGQPIIVRVELDGRVIAESTVNQLQQDANQGRFPLAGLA